VAALDRIPQSSALYLRARVEATRMFVRQGSAAPKLDDLVSASSLVESLSLEEINRLRLTSQIFTAAVAQASAPGTASAKNLKILGRPVEDRQLRLGLESSLRGLARFTDGEERIHLVDQANQVRPMTLI
jgi:serine/threonine-protein kinase PknG